MKSTPTAGYTLLELLVVLAIMSLIIASLPAITLHVVETSKRDNAIENLNWLLSNYHDLSVETGHTIVISESMLEKKARMRIRFINHRQLVYFPDGSSSDTIIEYFIGQQHITYPINLITGTLAR